MLDQLRRLAPKPIISLYHRLTAAAAAGWYHWPSRQLVVIGVTGTDGKTTTVTMIADLLTSGGHTVGLSSTVWMQIGTKRWLNESHMTMPGRFALQRLLRQMVKAGCDFAVIEVSSEGLDQWRHSGVDFDAAVITNLSPEHLKTHGTFERYRQAKEKLFGQIIKSGDKRGRDARLIKKITVVNLDDPSAEQFLKYWAEQKFGVTLQAEPKIPDGVTGEIKVFRAKHIARYPGGSSFEVDGHKINLNLPGDYNILNALVALAVASAFGLDWVRLTKAVAEIKPVPGRWQEIATNKPWRVIIDYALTPPALTQFYQTLKQTGAKRTIAVFGAAGGGRDAWKRPELGKIAAQYADIIILTTDDPYNEDPAQIAGAIISGVPPAQRPKFTIIIDRRQAIRRAVALAQPGDVVAITGMGAETSMMIKGKKVRWNDAAVVEEILAIK